jgi:signal transduction histidine kinase
VRKEADPSVVLVRLAALLRAASVPAAPLPAASFLGPKRILAVDDSPTYLHEVAAQLRLEGYEVVTARSGEEALDLLSVQRPDCVLLDLVMPGLSGHETCRRIKSVPGWREIPLMILTAHDGREAMIDGINSGADDYIPKSDDFDVLKARLRAQLRRKQFEDENRLIREELLRKEMEAADARAAQEASRLKSEFLASMSHELRTPLNAIIGFSQLMYDGKAGPVAPEHREYLGDILLSAQHLLQLINDVLDLSKVEAGRMEFRPEPVPIAAVLAAVRDTIMPLAAQKGIVVETEIDPRVAVVTIDAARLKQVLYNYLSNAIKFSPDASRVTVRVAPEGDQEWRLEVEDRGIGIAPEDLGKLFQAFRQLDAGLARKHEGTGLGLALTKRIVESQAGRVGVRSTPGQGSVFFAVFPH